MVVKFTASMVPPKCQSYIILYRINILIGLLLINMFIVKSKQVSCSSRRKGRTGRLRHFLLSCFQFLVHFCDASYLLFSVIVLLLLLKLNTLYLGQTNVVQPPSTTFLHRSEVLLSANGQHRNGIGPFRPEWNGHSIPTRMEQSIHSHRNGMLFIPFQPE